MKVQSWRDFITALALLIGTSVYMAHQITWGNGIFLGACLALLIASFNLLCASLSEKKYQKLEKQRADERQIRREMFGAFGPFAPYVGLVLLLIAYFMQKVTDAILLPLLVFLAGLVCSIWLAVTVTHRRWQKEDAEAQRDDNPQR